MSASTADLPSGPRPPAPARVIRLRPERILDEHVHEHWDLAVPLEGVVVQSAADGRSVAVPGEVMVIEPGRRHRNECGADGCRHLFLHVLSLGDVFPERRPVPDPGAWTLPPRATELARDLAEILLGPDDPATVRELAVVLVASLRTRREDSPPPPWLHRVRERVVEEPHDPPELAELATMAGVHPSTVLRRYRARYGATPAEFNRKWRLEEAAARVREGSQPLSWIAAEFGFVDQSHLTRLFRRRFGVTPGAYRARHAGRAGEGGPGSAEASCT